MHQIRDHIGRIGEEQEPECQQGPGQHPPEFVVRGPEQRKTQAQGDQGQKEVPVQKGVVNRVGIVLTVGGQAAGQQDHSRQIQE